VVRMYISTLPALCPQIVAGQGATVLSRLDGSLKCYHLANDAVLTIFLISLLSWEYDITV
jgi:hypothetical protein